MINNKLINTLPILPKNMLSGQTSSHHRNGVNKDMGNFLYTDENGESVLFDAMGPGCIKSIFSTKILNGTSIKFYFDGEEKPRYDIPILDLFSGNHQNFSSPMVSLKRLGYFMPEDAMGGNLIMPILFDKSLKITITGDRNIFYHIIWEKYPLGFNGHEGDISDYEKIWLPPEGVNEELLEKAEAHSIDFSKREKVFQDKGSKFIRSITIQGTRSDAFLKDVVLCMRWDDNLYDSVHVPVGDFFAIPAGPVKINTPLITVDIPNDYTVRLTCRWPMPYWKNAEISLLNLGQRTMANIKVLVETEKQKYDIKECGYFTAHHHSGSTEYGRDWSLFKAKGWGKYVGTIQQMMGEHYCEGDEHFTMDGSCTPQINGTGSEDYYLFCFWPNPQITTPYNGTTTDVFLQGGGFYNNSYTYPSVYYRFHLDSPIAFYSGINAEIQHGGMSNIHSRYSSVAFCYMRRTPALVLSDSFDVSNSEARKMHRYSAGEAESVTTESSFIGNDINVRSTISGFKHSEGEIDFIMAVDSANDGVILRRRIDQSHGRQKAEVWIDGNFAGTWYDSNTNKVHRWHDSDFLVPSGLSNGKSLLRIKLKIVLCGDGKFTEYGYRAFSFVPPSSDLFNEQETIMGGITDLWPPTI